MKLATVALAALLSGCAALRDNLGPITIIGCAVALAACNQALPCAVCDVDCSQGSQADRSDPMRALACIRCLEECAR